MRQPSILTRVLAAGAQRLAERWQVPAENREAFLQVASYVLESEWSTRFGGEQVRVWAPRTPAAERQARRGRILQASQSGESPTLIAQREGVSARTVRRLVR
jgi:hypothetical protein